MAKEKVPETPEIKKPARRKGGLGKGLGAFFDDALFVDYNTPVTINAEKAEATPKKTSDKTVVKADKPSAKAAATSNASKSGSTDDSTINASKDVKEIVDDSDRIRFLSIDDIKPNSKQPRKVFNEEKIAELATSIVENGMIQPILVIPSKNGYELVAGERRLRAARVAGIKEIPSIVRDLSEEQNTFFALIENMQREDLNPVEEATAIRSIMDTYSLTQDDMSKKIGKSRPYVANLLRMLKLPTDVVSLLNEGKLTLGHANAISIVKDEEQRIILANQIVTDGLSVRRAEELAASVGNNPIKKHKATARVKNDEVRHIEEELGNILGTKVALNFHGKNGHIEIAYYSNDQLEDLIDMMRTLSN
jgi:ParB family chromosome partitioning protein